MVPQVLGSREVEVLRDVLHDTFGAGASTKRLLLASHTLRIPEVYLLPFRERIVNALKQIVGGAYTMFANFNVQRNQFGGWHTDAASEGNAPYLLGSDYRFIKCGIFLQQDTRDWGGAIQVVPGGHRFPLGQWDTRVNFKLKRIANHVGQKWFARPLDISAGDFVAFDYRLPHSATWPQPQNRGEVTDGTMAGIARDRTKFAIYWDIGSTECATNYLRHSAKRAEHEELGRKSLEPFFTDYLSLRFPDDYPRDFVSAVTAAGIHIATLDRAAASTWARRYAALQDG